MSWLDLKEDISKVKNTFAQMDFTDISENQTFQRTAKYPIADFYEMDFMKGICYISKSR